MGEQHVVGGFGREARPIPRARSWLPWPWRWLEHRLQVIERIARRWRTGRPSAAMANSLAAAAGRIRPTPASTSPIITSSASTRLRGVHDELAAAAERHALHRGDPAPARTSGAAPCALENDGLAPDQKRPAAQAPRRPVAGWRRPRTAPRARSPRHRARSAWRTAAIRRPASPAADAVHLGLERQMPMRVDRQPPTGGRHRSRTASRRTFPGAAPSPSTLRGRTGAGRPAAERGTNRIAARGIRTLRRMHAGPPASRPSRRRGIAHRLAGGDVGGDCLAMAVPAGRPARSRTDPAPSRSPSAWRGR